MPELIAATSVSVPAPVGGWNTRDSLDAMPEADAIRLINLIPGTNSVRNRRGSVLFADSMGSGPVDTLAEWVGANGSSKLIAAANLNIYDCTAGGAGVSLASGFSSNQWQTALFRNSGATTQLIMVNGADTPRGYDGGAVGSITYTGSGLTPANFVNVSAYRSRLYFVEKDTTKVWYTNTPGASSGACTEFDVGSLFQQGGYLMAAVPSTRDSESGTQEQFVFISSQGDVLVYTGTNPGDVSWTITGRFQIPAPIGRRCTAYLGAELLILTNQGVLPFSAILANQGKQSYALLTNKIQSAFVSAANNYRVNFGWQMLPYQQQNLLYVNIPTATGSQAQQAVLNTITGALCQFVGANACCWCLFNNVPYYGSSSGRVHKFDTGFSDSGISINYDGKTAFNYFGDRARLKRLTFARPLITTTQTFTLGFNIDVDFDDRALATGAAIVGSAASLWDVSPWDSSTWSGAAVANNEMYSVDGLGRCAAFRFKGGYFDLEFELTAFHLNYEPGGIL